MDLDKIASKWIYEEEELVHKEMDPVYRIIYRFIANKCILYGGYALHMLMPEKFKLYSPDEFPDYDCFTINGLKVLKELADILYAKGYKYVHVRRSFHDHTYKLIVNFTPVLDCTDIPPNLYHRMMELSRRDYAKKKLDMTIAPLYFFRYSMHYEFGKPMSSAHRWSKLLDRNKKLKRVFPIHHKPMNLFQETNTTILKCCDQIIQYVKHHKLPISGSYAWIRWMNQDIKFTIHPDLGFMDILSLNALETAKEIKRQLDKQYPTIKFIIKYVKDPVNFMYKTKDFTPPMERSLLPSLYEMRVIINGEMRKLASVYDTIHECISITHMNGMSIVTRDSLLRYFYANALVKPEYAELYANAAAVLESTVTDKKRFSKSCFGKELRLLDIRKQSWDSKKGSVLFIPESKN